MGIWRVYYVCLVCFSAVQRQTAVTAYLKLSSYCCSLLHVGINKKISDYLHAGLHLLMKGCNNFRCGNHLHTELGC